MKVVLNNKEREVMSMQSFKTLFDSLFDNLVKIGIYYLNDAAAAKDIVQDLFVRIWEKREELSHIDDYAAYLRRSIRNSCFDYISHYKVVEKYRQDYIKECLHEERLQAFENELCSVNNLLEKLPEKRREILKLNIVESYSYQQIAEELDVSVNTVKDHMKKAYAFLRTYSKKQINDMILCFALSR